MSTTPVADPRRSVRHEQRPPVFEGLRVADFSWAAAGPIVTRFLADYGATVVRIESSTHMDSVRFGGPFRDGVPNINKSGFFAEFNAGKKSITLNMSDDDGRDVARQLVGWSDVVAESFAPGIMDKWGLGWDDVHRLNPRAIMMSSSLRGANGPQSNYRGYGGQGAAVSGLHLLTGWPDRNPAGPKGAYTDAIAPRFAMAALMAALVERDRTGLGQYVEMSQVETAIQFLATELMDYQVNGVVAGPQGNRSPYYAPHGAYPCEGEDRWVAIAVETTEQWERLVVALGSPDWAVDPRWLDDAHRLGAQDVFDEHIASWTSSRDAYEVMDILQSAGVPCGVVQKPSDLFDDPQLREREHFIDLEGGEMGRVGYNTSAFRLSETPGLPSRGTPDLGEHTEHVLRDILELDSTEVQRLLAGEGLR